MQMDLFNQTPEQRPKLNIRKRAQPAKPATGIASAKNEAHAQAERPHRVAGDAATPSKRVGQRRINPPSRPHEAAFDLAEAVASAWYKAGGDNRFEVPLGAIAGVALWPLKGHDIAPIVADWWRTLTETETNTALEECFARWWIARPDLIEAARPIHEWLTYEATATKYATPVRAAITAALDAGLLDLLGDHDPYYRSTTDVVGSLMTCFRSTGHRYALAEFHTPPEVAELMARILLGGERHPGESFDDPCAGSGGMHRATAQILREQGHDPADYQWSMTDVDPIATACAAVNAILWELGPHVLVWCGDTLAEGDGPQRAARRRARVIEHRDQQISVAKLLKATRELTAGALASVAA
ncbi:N-6 DNA methylase [Kitasatospora acidiphila]|uniref:N-6 DNA methylase n=1 Tax=Kitasatospora acidiphila TaxID=2567942 RepID=A0A540W9B5_9ACTN|nr:N-6 DNA methylase [Kitasatospora acidiphila]TQF05588.1 N-6 DNA methylase [Kitasatospora acidiphila]